VSIEPTLEDWFSALTTSQDRLSRLVESLSPDELATQSYDTEWSVAQVLSHLGSGAEIFSLYLLAGLGQGTSPGMGELEPLWARWNALTPAEQAAGFLVADRTFLDQLRALDDQQRQGWQLDMVGEVRRLSDLLRFRLGEHALHTWDIAVTRDATATVAPDAVALLIDTIDQLARRGQPGAGMVRVSVITEDPDRRFLLVSDGEAVELRGEGDVDGAGGTARLALPAEALIRLVYGRLDPAHTPPVAGDQELDVLRRIFPGF
jgi:uncharacterized protein (TIGR03083 family)